MHGMGFTDPGPLQLIFGLLGGLALFLYGMGQMADSSAMAPSTGASITITRLAMALPRPS